MEKQKKKKIFVTPDVQATPFLDNPPPAHLNLPRSSKCRPISVARTSSIISFRMSINMAVGMSGGGGNKLDNLWNKKEEHVCVCICEE